MTSYEDFVFEGYHVNALNYILKPLSYEQFSACMEYICNRMECTYFFYRNQKQVQRIPYKDILYFSSSNQYIEIHTCSDTYRSNEPLKGVLCHLPLYFVQCHRSIIVNLDYVEKIVKRDLYLSGGVVLPVSKKYLKPLQSAYMKNLQLNGF